MTIEYADKAGGATPETRAAGEQPAAGKKQGRERSEIVARAVALINRHVLLRVLFVVLHLLALQQVGTWGLLALQRAATAPVPVAEGEAT